MTRTTDDEPAATPVRVVTSTSCCTAIPTDQATAYVSPPQRNRKRAWVSVAAVALGAFIIVMTETLPVGLLPEVAAGLGVSLGLVSVTNLQTLFLVSGLVLVASGALALTARRLVTLNTSK